MRRSYLRGINQRLGSQRAERRDVYRRSLPQDHGRKIVCYRRGVHDPMATEAAGRPQSWPTCLSYQGMMIKGHLVKAGPVSLWPVKGGRRDVTLKPGPRLFPVVWIAGRHNQQTTLPFPHGPTVRCINEKGYVVGERDSRVHLKGPTFHRFDGQLYPQSSTDLAGPASGCDDDDFDIEILRPCFTFVAKGCPGLACFLDESLQNQRRIVRAIKMAEIGGNDPGCIEERYQGSRVWMRNRQPCRNLNLCSLLEFLCCCRIFCRVEIANGLKADALGPLNEEGPRC